MIIGASVSKGLFSWCMPGEGWPRLGDFDVVVVRLRPSIFNGDIGVFFGGGGSGSSSCSSSSSSSSPSSLSLAGSRGILGGGGYDFLHSKKGNVNNQSRR